MQVPITNFLPYRLSGFVADSWTEIDKILSLAASRKTRPEREPQKVKALVGIVALSVAAFTIDNLCLLQIQFQSTFSQSALDSCQQELGLLLAHTVADYVIGITFKRYFRKMSLHPPIQCIVQKKIGKQSTDDATLRRPLPPV
jgi:hypothetical protein